MCLFLQLICSVKAPPNTSLPWANFDIHILEMLFIMAKSKLYCCLTILIKLKMSLDKDLTHSPAGNRQISKKS